MRLCCWKTALEMLMQYRHNNIYGVANGVARAAHTPAVQAADARNRGFSIGELANDYGLRQVNNLTEAVADWQAVLGHAPVLLTGRYGMARTGIGGHVVLAIGLSNSDKVVYLDPFRTGWGRNDNYIYMTRAEAIERVFISFNVLDAWTTV